jgi:sugar phosphate isomerase/epimerase
MQIGIFAKTFARPTVEGVFDAVRAAGLDCVQFNMSCAGLPTLPETVDERVPRRIRQAAEERGIAIAAVSGTFNMIDPDIERRADSLRRLDVLAGACHALGTRLITLCTGTRDPVNMWRRHPDNDTPSAWEELAASLREAARIGDAHDIDMGIEPEVSNVIDSAVKCRRMLDQIGSPRLRVVMDGANLFHAGQLPRMREVLDEAFALLGPDIALAHAKDLARDGEAGDRAAGTGVLDYDHYLDLLRKSGYDGPLVLHGLDEADVPGSVEFLGGKLP